MQINYMINFSIRKKNSMSSHVASNENVENEKAMKTLGICVKSNNKYEPLKQVIYIVASAIDSIIKKN